jgi:hypothetical protein
MRPPPLAPSIWEGVWVDGAVKERERRRWLPEQRGEGGRKGGGGGRAGGEGVEDEALVWAEEERVGGWGREIRLTSGSHRR